MANFRNALMILFVAFAAMAMVVHSGNHALDFAFGSNIEGRGLIADAMDNTDEFQMESESTRRQMTQAAYISYGALRRNNVPCNRRGTSYYDCRRHAKVNPYQRGCTKVTYCARSNN